MSQYTLNRQVDTVPNPFPFRHSIVTSWSLVLFVGKVELNEIFSKAIKIRNAWILIETTTNAFAIGTATTTINWAQ